MGKLGPSNTWVYKTGPSSYALVRLCTVNACFCFCCVLQPILERKFYREQGKVTPYWKGNESKSCNDGNHSQRQRYSINLYLALFPQDNWNPRGNTA